MKHKALWSRLSDPKTLLLGSIAALLIALLIGGILFNALGKGIQYVEQWIGVMLGLVAGVASSAIFAFVQFRNHEAHLEAVYGALTRLPYYRTQSEEYKMDGSNSVILLPETLNEKIKIERTAGTHTIVAQVEYGPERGTVRAELSFDPHQQLHAEGTFEYVAGKCAPRHGQYRMDVLDKGARIRVRWSSVSNIKGHEGWEMWARQDFHEARG